MLDSPPSSDEVEVSIFGPGKGESVVVHLGDDDWVIVDSCVDQVSRTNPALTYLSHMNVDVANRVRLVVATHAHDDHFKGIAQIYDACESASLVCSEAFTKEELYALSRQDERDRAYIRKSAYSEYRRLNELVVARGISPAGIGFLKYGGEQKELLNIRRTGGVNVRVLALSPSAEATRRAREYFMRALNAYEESIRVPDVDPNELAVALWIEVGGHCVLLGADVLTGPAGCGWEAVLGSHAPSSIATLFKIPHHGSDTGHHDEVWTRLLEGTPVGLLAPYRAGRKRLPSLADRQRICRLTTNAHITANPDLPAPSKSTKRATAALGPLAMNVREPWGVAGHVRARVRIGRNKWTVEHTRPGRALCAG